MPRIPVNSNKVFIYNMIKMIISVLVSIAANDIDARVCHIGSRLYMDLPGGTTERTATVFAIEPLVLASPSGSQRPECCQCHLAGAVAAVAPDSIDTQTEPPQPHRLTIPNLPINDFQTEIQSNEENEEMVDGRRSRAVRIIPAGPGQIDHDLVGAVGSGGRVAEAGR